MCLVILKLNSFMKPNENLDDLSYKPSENYETDVQKLVRRHLEDENHVITDEELRNLKVGVDPLPAENQTAQEQSSSI